MIDISNKVDQITVMLELVKQGYAIIASANFEGIKLLPKKD
jgi:hypothetical protein